MQRPQGENRHHDALEGCHPKPGVVVVVKIARCGTPVFAPIEVERLMMQAEQKPDAKFLSRKREELVGCSGSPLVGERGKGT